MKNMDTQYKNFNWGSKNENEQYIKRICIESQSKISWSDFLSKWKKN